EAVDASAGGIGEVEGGRSGAANAVGAQGEFMVEVDVGTRVALAAGKAGGEQRLSEVLRAGGVDAAAIHPGALAFLGGEEFIAGGIVDDSGDEFAVGIGGEAGRAMLQPHGDAEDGEGMGEVRGAVQRIDVPAVLGLEAVARAFFAEDAVAGKASADALDDQLFGGAVGFSDEVNVALVFGNNAALEEAAQQGSGFECDFRACHCPVQTGWNALAHCPSSAGGTGASARRGRRRWSRPCSVMVRIWFL